MPVTSLYKSRQVCGVDMTPGRRVCVLAHRDGKKLLFQTVPESPGSCETACAIPSRSSLVRRIVSPFKSVSKTRRVLSSLMDVQMPFSVEECAMAFTRLKPDDDGQISAIATAVRHDDVRAWLADCTNSGVDPVYLYSEGLALWCGSMAEIPAEQGERVAVLKVEPSGATLCLGVGQAMLSAHALSDLSQGHFKRLLAAVFDSASGIAWRLAGKDVGSGEAEGFIKSLGQEWLGSVTVHSEPDVFLARSVARMAASSDAEGLNLLRDDFQHESLGTRIRERNRAVALVLAGSGIALCAMAFAVAGGIRGKLKAMESDFLDRSAELADGELVGQRGIHALQLAQAAVEERLSQAAPLLAPFSPSPVGLVRDIAAECAKADLLIEVLSVTTGSIRVEGSADEWKGPEGLVEFLRNRGFSVKLDREESLADESVRFKAIAEGVI